MRLVLVLLAVFFSACSARQESSEQVDFQQITQNPLSPEETKQMMQEVAGNWFYGQGVGDTAVKAGTAIAFPPYALVLIGNAVASLSGYEPVGITDVIPGQAGAEVENTYNSVTSVPGQVTSAAAGEHFRDRHTIRKNMRRYLTQNRMDDPDVG